MTTATDPTFVHVIASAVVLAFRIVQVALAGIGAAAILGALLINASVGAFVILAGFTLVCFAGVGVIEIVFVWPVRRRVGDG